MNAKLHLTEWSTCSTHLYWSHQYQVDHFYSISPQQTTLSEWFCFGPVRRYRKEREVGRRSASHWSNMKENTTHMDKTCLALVWASQKFRHSFLDHSVRLLARMDPLPVRETCRIRESSSLADAVVGLWHNLCHAESNKGGKPLRIILIYDQPCHLISL